MAVVGIMIDLTGSVFGRLTVINESQRRVIGGKKRRMYICVCECGKLACISIDALRYGLTTSCGCKQIEAVRKMSTTHGLSRSRIAKTYGNIKSRCLNPKSTGYEHYGGRGITLCEKWMSFEGFYEDMGPSYVDKYTIERIDVNGNYCKDNCAWISEHQQHRNTRQTVWVPYNGKKVSLVEFCEKEHLRYGTVQGRLKRGVPWEVAINPNRLTKTSRRGNYGK